MVKIIIILSNIRQIHTYDRPTVLHCRSTWPVRPRNHDYYIQNAMLLRREINLSNSDKRKKKITNNLYEFGFQTPALIYSNGVIIEMKKKEKKKRNNNNSVYSLALSENRLFPWRMQGAHIVQLHIVHTRGQMRGWKLSCNVRRALHDSPFQNLPIMYHVPTRHTIADKKCFRDAVFTARKRNNNNNTNRNILIKSEKSRNRITPFSKKIYEFFTLSQKNVAHVSSPAGYVINW